MITAGTRRPELDGLRGLAIGLVLASHVVGETQGGLGLVGVSLFFTLSGYLITGSLEARPSLRSFYGRRFRRLAPALAALILFTVVLGLVGVWGHQPWLTSAIGLATYTANWFEVAGYIAVPFGHVWTLAIEEQFYFVWPLLFGILTRRAMLLLLFGAIVLGVWSRGQGGQFAYFASTSYLDVIGLGCAAAVAGWRFGPRLANIALPLIALAVVAESPALAAIGATAICASSGSVLSPLAGLGRRGYSLYLWDWPMTLLFGPAGIVPTFVAAELSYRFVEWRFAIRHAVAPEGLLGDTARSMGEAGRPIRGNVAIS
jgi:peptidoglycan/LPS O-acetylase OafA/YrhL